jgi:hypothetical protein
MVQNHYNITKASLLEHYGWQITAEIIESFRSDLRRMQYKYDQEKIKMVALDDIPELTISFPDGKPSPIGPYEKDATFIVPVWLGKILKANGLALLHREERTEDFILSTGDKKSTSLPPYFYNKCLDWMDTVDKLSTSGMVSDTMGKRLRSRFISFLETRYKYILNSLALPASSFIKNLSLEEQLLAKQLQALLNEWERVVLKREA